MFGVSWLKHLQHIMRHLNREKPSTQYYFDSVFVVKMVI